MNQEDKVTSLELSRKLRYAGADQDCEFYWSKLEKDIDSESRLCQRGTITLGISEWEDLAAFDCAELLERLPKGVLIKKYNEGYFICELRIGDSGKILNGYKNTSEALGLIYLWCLQNGHPQK